MISDSVKAATIELSGDIAWGALKDHFQRMDVLAPMTARDCRGLAETMFEAAELSNDDQVEGFEDELAAAIIRHFGLSVVTGRFGDIEAVRS